MEPTLHILYVKEFPIKYSDRAFFQIVVYMLGKLEF